MQELVLAAGEEVTVAFSLAKRLPDFNVTNSAIFSSVLFPSILSSSSSSLLLSILELSDTHVYEP